jgi:hypothetical protein
MMASARQTFSSRAMTCFLTSKSSKTASTTRSAASSFDQSVVPVIRSRIAFASSGRKIFRETPSASVLSTMAKPRATFSSSKSTRITGNPSVAAFWAMPLPMLPAPTTARVRTGRGDVIGKLLRRERPV